MPGLKKKSDLREKPNIIFITVDALRALNLGCFGYPIPTTPNIDKLARRGLLFENYFTCTTSTDPAFTSLFSGRYPFSHGIINHASRVTPDEEKKVTGIKPLPEFLQEEGYRTFALDFLGRWHKRGFGFYLGVEAKEKEPFTIKLVGRAREIFGIQPGTWIQKIFEKTPIYKFLLDYFDRWLTPYTRADKLTDRAIEILRENRDKRLFLFLHYWDPHQPYVIHKNYSEKLKNLNYEKIYGESEKTISEILATKCSVLVQSALKDSARGNNDPLELVRLYDAEIAFLDAQIGRLIAALKKLKLFDKSLIVFTADHGESLIEHRYFTHEGLYQEILHIPLIFVGPGIPKGRRRSLSQIIDLTPTILDLLNIKAKTSFDGLSLLPVFKKDREIRKFIFAHNNSPIRNEACLIQGRYKYLRALGEKGNICTYCGKAHGPYEELFDLKSGSGEKKNVVGKKTEVTKKLRNQLDKFIRRLEEKSSGSRYGKRKKK
jgi:arylsulfatase A-like enzyme